MSTRHWLPLATPAQVRREVHRTSKGVRRYFVAAIIVVALGAILDLAVPMATGLSLIHISEPTRRHHVSRMPSSA